MKCHFYSRYKQHVKLSKCCTYNQKLGNEFLSIHSEIFKVINLFLNTLKGRSKKLWRNTVIITEKGLKVVYFKYFYKTDAAKDLLVCNSYALQCTCLSFGNAISFYICRRPGVEFKKFKPRLKYKTRFKLVGSTWNCIQCSRIELALSWNRFLSVQWRGLKSLNTASVWFIHFKFHNNEFLNINKKIVLSLHSLNVV